MDLNSYQMLLLERDGHVLTATFNQPEKRNPAGGKTTQELIRLFTEVATDKQTHVVVLTGAGKAFSAGGDLSVIHDNLDNPDFYFDAVPEAKALIYAIIDCPKPVIAKVNGAAIGLGSSIAVACDLTYTVDDAKIGDTHVKLGLVPGDGGSALWPVLVGFSKAKELLFTGDIISGKRAAEIGLVTASFPTLEALHEHVHVFAQRLAEGPNRTIQYTKLGINIALKRAINEVFDATLAYEALSGAQQDHREGIKSMLEKRPAKFNGA